MLSPAVDDEWTGRCVAAVPRTSVTRGSDGSCPQTERFAPRTWASWDGAAGRQQERSAPHRLQVH
jgi:hypothetical protein